RPAIISRNCGAISTGGIRSASTSSGGWSFGGTAAGERLRTSTWTTIATDEERRNRHVDEQAQADDGGRDADRGVHGAFGADPGRARRGHGRPAQARQRAVQQSPKRHRRDGADPGPRVRHQPGLLAERAAPLGHLGGDAQPQGNGAYQAGEALESGGVKPSTASAPTPSPPSAAARKYFRSLE